MRDFDSVPAVTDLPTNMATLRTRSRARSNNMVAGLRAGASTSNCHVIDRNPLRLSIFAGEDPEKTPSHATGRHGECLLALRYPEVHSRK